MHNIRLICSDGKFPEIFITIYPEAVLPLGGLGGRLGRQISGGGKFFLEKH
jgi:hypothetical protein